MNQLISDLLIVPLWNLNELKGEALRDGEDLLIVPLWNLNNDSRDCLCSMIPFNRTIMEFKFDLEGLTVTFVAPFNRTIMEFKLIQVRYQHYRD